MLPVDVDITLRTLLDPPLIDEFWKIFCLEAGLAAAVAVAFLDFRDETLRSLAIGSVLFVLPLLLVLVLPVSLLVFCCLLRTILIK